MLCHSHVDGKLRIEKRKEDEMENDITKMSGAGSRLHSFCHTPLFYIQYYMKRTVAWQWLLLLEWKTLRGAVDFHNCVDKESRQGHSTCGGVAQRLHLNFWPIRFDAPRTGERPTILAKISVLII